MKTETRNKINTIISIVIGLALFVAIVLLLQPLSQPVNPKAIQPEDYSKEVTKAILPYVNEIEKLEQEKEQCYSNIAGIIRKEYIFAAVEAPPREGTEFIAYETGKNKTHHSIKQVFKGKYVKTTRVNGSSMAPSMRTNDIVFISTTKEYRIGDVILTSNGVLHRISNITQKCIRTKGDNNAEKDVKCWKEDDILGKMVVHVPVPYREVGKK